MFKIYEIVFHPQHADQPIGTTFRPFSATYSEGQAWGMAKAAWMARKIKTVIIGPDGTPIGGY